MTQRADASPAGWNRWGRRGIVVALCVMVAGIALTWRPVIAPINPPPHTAFAPGLVAQGAALAAIGDCAICHTASHGQPFAGGYGLPTPFGTIYSTNITPDAQTGIGAWSEVAFRRALRRGIDRIGRHLYPALPYTHFTHATDQDIAALYAFLMTRAPVHAVTPPNTLPFPVNVRATLAGWKLLFFQPGVWRPDPAKSAEWNRGAYLVEAVGHCAACHTPRNALGAERTARPFDGGDAEGWDAPALGAASAAQEPWTADALYTYLRTGFEAHHGAAAGPMGPVTHELAAVPDADVRAIAVYIAAMAPQAPVSNPPHPASDAAGNAVFAGACGSCHGADAPITRGGAPSLALSSAINAPTARNAVQMILHGIPWREGAADPYMPGFADVLSDRQIADLVHYLRGHFSNKPAWPDAEPLVRSARKDGGE
jgi:mono/diheme cytochrome c family protein